MGKAARIELMNLVDSTIVVAGLLGIGFELSGPFQGVDIVTRPILVDGSKQGYTTR